MLCGFACVLGVLFACYLPDGFAVWGVCSVLFVIWWLLRDVWFFFDWLLQTGALVLAFWLVSWLLGWFGWLMVSWICVVCCGCEVFVGLLFGGDVVRLLRFEMWVYLLCFGCSGLTLLYLL